MRTGVATCVNGGNRTHIPGYKSGAYRLAHVHIALAPVFPGRQSVFPNRQKGVKYAPARAHGRNGTLGNRTPALQAMGVGPWSDMAAPRRVPNEISIRREISTSIP